jgi:hypothetical protein
MKPQQVTHDICRLYLKDLLLQPWSEEERAVLTKISGFHRSRDIAALSSVTKHVGLACPTVQLFRALLQIEAFYKKNAAFAEDEKCMTAARASFLDAEAHCRITNRRLDWYYMKPERLAPDLRSYLSKMERFIHSVLGPFEEFLEDLPRELRVTDGATASGSRRNSLPFMKIRRSYHCPSRARPYLRAAALFFGMPVPKLKVCSTNRVEVVPKNWETYRTIACEPDGVMPFQLAFDSYGKRRLKRVGIDLSSQSKNQSFAREGSVSNKIATVDLKSASDTAAYNAVAWLFPELWFQYLDAFRSTDYKGPFGVGNYAKFSSMGNGSTFVIETLIFASACAAVGSKIRCVYGDDIIIESHLVDELIRLLRFIGFVVNQGKTHVNGPYRESCGEHWYEGQLITPFYVRDEFRLRSEMCHLVNGLASICVPRGHLWEYLLSLVESLDLPVVPFNESSTSGIYCLPADALAAKLIRTRLKQHMWVPVYRAFVSKTKSKVVADSRTLFLWYLDAYRSERSERDVLVPRARCRSTVSLPTHRFVRKWVCWRQPARPLPTHLYWWSEDLVLHKARTGPRSLPGPKGPE